MILIDIDDENIETGYLDEVRRCHFSDGVHVTYFDVENDNYLVREYVSGVVTRILLSDAGEV